MAGGWDSGVGQRDMRCVCVCVCADGSRITASGPGSRDSIGHSRRTHQDDDNTGHFRRSRLQPVQQIGNDHVESVDDERA